MSSNNNTNNTRSENSNTKYGSFKVRILNEETNKYTTYSVNPLSQNELSNNWQLVLPRKKKYMVKIKNEETGETREELKSNSKYFKINMAQLPGHLFHKIRPVYNSSGLTHYTASERIYNYLVYPSPIDDQIIDMARLLNLSEKRYLTQSELDQLREYNQLMRDNDIYGWTLLKSQRLVGE